MKLQHNERERSSCRVGFLIVACALRSLILFVYLVLNLPHNKKKKLFFFLVIFIKMTPLMNLQLVVIKREPHLLESSCFLGFDFLKIRFLVWGFSLCAGRSPEIET